MNRIIGFDVARALALFGMVIVNFKLAMEVSDGATIWHSFAHLFEGRASALFVILAGIGIAILTNKALVSKKPEDTNVVRKSLLKRGLLLIVIGLAYTPIWEADILHFYGFYFIIAAFLFTLAPKRLLLISIAFVVAFPVLWGFFDYEHGWDWATYSYAGFWTMDGMIRHIVFNGFHPIFPWCGFLIFGIWLGRHDLSKSGVQKSLFTWALSILVITELTFYMLRTWATDNAAVGLSQEEIEFVLSTSIIPPLPQYMLSAGSSAVLMILICVKLTSAFPNSRLIEYLGKTGRLALTLYIAHVIVGMGTLESLGLLYNQSIELSLIASLVFCFSSVVFSMLWLKRFKIGPLESMFKKLI